MFHLRSSLPKASVAADQMLNCEFALGGGAAAAEGPGTAGDELVLMTKEREWRFLMPDSGRWPGTYE